MSPVIDEAVAVGERCRVAADIGMRCPRRADPQRSVHDPHFDAIAVDPDHAGGKALEAIIDGKADARLGRSVSVPDRGVGKGLAQTIEHRLVGDLTGQPDIAGRKARGRAAHQKLAPMRWRAGDVRDAHGIEAGDVIGERLAGAVSTIEPPLRTARRKIWRPP